MTAAAEIIEAPNVTYPSSWSGGSQEVIRSSFAGMTEDVVPRWVSESRARILEIEASGVGAAAILHATRVLQFLRRQGLRPTRVDPVDGEAVTFLFVKHRAQGSIDCYDTGEIVFAYSNATSQDDPKMWAFSQFEPTGFRDAVDYIRRHTR